LELLPHRVEIETDLDADICGWQVQPLVGDLAEYDNIQLIITELTVNSLPLSLINVLQYDRALVENSELAQSARLGKLVDLLAKY
jgi:hypothetical protein